MKKTALDVVARLRKEGRQIYAAMGIEQPGRDLDTTLEEEVLEVFKLYIRRETAIALGVPVVEQVEDDSEETE